ncbi:MAG TPA: ACP S-malonyltransferase [Candidatus Cloacimonadota bacterium]|nr:ACP S-malonyltransferase [Candidatus Cloacimonadota bacterium]HQL15181.1 ACP S-malonyltransferase [Candidatus Cloacimonadota bacterium]
MKKTAFVFPGQGAQYVGMAMDFVASEQELENILHDFDREHGTNLYEIMKNGPEAALTETRITQPAILFHSICAYQALMKRAEIKPEFVAGHSLGEFTALVAAGVLSLQDAMHIVHKRGEFMIKANKGVPFAMSAIIGLPPEEVVSICAEAEKVGLVRAVNFNTPSQTVISGTKEGVEAAGELAKTKGAKRVLPLTVGGPFHTPLIEQASVWLAEEMQRFTFHDALVPVVSNLDALPETNGNAIREKLVKQIISPVKWSESVQYMLQQGIGRFIEFGPQRVLSGMIKNIDKDVEILNVDKVDDVEKIIGQLNQG